MLMVIFFFCFCSKSRLCSQHFVDGKPTQQHPYPTEELGYSIKRQPSVRKAPSVRLPLESSKRKRSQDLHMVQDTKSPDLQNDPFLVDAIARRSADSDMSDHCYTKSTVTHCTDCEVLQKQTAQLQQQLEQLQSSQKAPASPISIISRFVGTDAKVNLNTGIKDRATLDTLHFLLYPKVKKMRYWAGTRVATTKKLHHFNRSPKKPGPQKKLQSFQELVLVLMKLRLGVTNMLLCAIFQISAGLCSKILNTWIPLMARQLQALVFWPGKEAVLQHMPEELGKKYPQLRCTIDCTEIFINKP